MPPPIKILFYVSSVKLQYKTDPPLRDSFFLGSSRSSSLLLLQILCVCHCIFIVLIVVFNILKGMILLSLSLYFFYFCYFNYDYFLFKGMIVASFSNNEDDLSLGADHEETPASTCDVASSSTVSQRRGSVPSQQSQFTRKYQAQWKDGLSMLVCLGLSFFFTYNIIYEQLMNILLILFNFRFINIKVARIITLAFKSSMEILLF